MSRFVSADRITRIAPTAFDDQLGQSRHHRQLRHLRRNEAVARAIADRAIDDWERAIVNFNYQGGGNTYNLTLNAAAIGGRGQTANIAHLAGKPISATVTMDDNAQGGGWYFDPVIGTSLVPDDGEYQTSFLNEFVANLSAPAGNDYYRTVAHEIGHAMGLTFTSGLLINNFTTDSNIDDPNSTGTATLRRVNFGGGDYEFTLTEMGGCHLYEGPTIPASGITQIHPNDMLNDGRTVSLGVNRRQLISDTLISLFQQAYGYTVIMPSQINSFYVNLNTTTNIITVNGDISGNGNDTDTILIENLGSTTRFTVNGAVETIDNAEYTSIVINAGLSNDTITIADLPAGKTVTANGGNHTDTLNFHDQANADDSTYTLTSTALTRSGLQPITLISINALSLFAGTGGDTIDINGSVIESLFVHAGAGADTINLIDHALTVANTLDGGAGLDVMNINTDGVGFAAAQIAVTQDLASLNIGEGGSVRMSTDGSLVIETDALSIIGNGTLDLADNDLIVDYNGATELATIQNLINTGRAGGTWLGSGITSNAAANRKPRATQPSA